MYTFLENRATPVERETFASTWSFYIRNVLGIAKESRHVWPFDVEFALRSGLVRIGKQMFHTSSDNSSNTSKPEANTSEPISPKNEPTQLAENGQSSEGVQVETKETSSEVANDRALVALTLEDFQQWLSVREPNENVQDVPASVVSSINDGSLVDPLSFPDDSQVYQSWKVISQAIETMDQGVSNIELQTRRIARQNNTLARDIERLRKITYVQDQFVSKFSIAYEQQ